MPFTLNLLTDTVPFTVWRDSAASQPVSVLNWQYDADAGRLGRAARQRTNLFRNGDFELLDTTMLAATGCSMEVVGDWSASRRHSLLVTPDGVSAPVIRQSPSNTISARPSHSYSAGITVRNDAAATKTFTLRLVIGDLELTETAILAAASVQRLTVTNQVAPRPTSFSQVAGVGSALFSPVALSLECLDVHTIDEPFHVDEIFFGEGPATPYVTSNIYDGYRTYELTSAEPVRLWVRNDSGGSSYNRLRTHAAVLGPEASRLWLVVNPDPDISPWELAYNRSVILRAGSFASGEILPFWIRLMTDEFVLAGKHHRLTLRLIGDQV